MSNRVYTNISNIGPISAAAAVTTSSVHEYICLYTHDLKRKTKRWQDGKLCYHVFNGRVVVYDDRGGIVGDSHVAGRPTSLDEGEEMALDRGGAIVQVCDRLGQREVDLEPLIDRRAREVEKRRREAAQKQKQRPAPVAVAVASPAQPLSTILSTTPGRIGRAVIPKESPYEQRQKQLQQQEEARGEPPPSKRVRTSPSEKSTHARGLFGTQLNLSAPTSSRSATVKRGQTFREKTIVTVSKEEVIQKATTPYKEEEDGMEMDRAKVGGSVVLQGRQRFGGLRVARKDVHADVQERTERVHLDRDGPGPSRDKSRQQSMGKTYDDSRRDAVRMSARDVLGEEISNEMSSPPQNTKKSVIAATFEADGESIPEANNEPPAKLAGEVTREKPASSRNQLQNTKKRIIATPFQDDSGDEDEPNDETPVNVAQKKQFSRQELVANKLPPPRIIPVETVDLDDSTPQDDNDEPPIWKRHEQKPSLDKPCPIPKKISRPEKTVKQTPTTTTNPTKQLSTISFKGPLKKDTATTDAATDGTTPRTELRIRARKKRGLLMLSKEKTIPPPAAPSSESEPQPVWLTASPVDSPAEESFEEWYAKSVAAKAANSGGDSEAVEEQTASELEDAHASIPEPEPEHNPTPEPESSIKERFPAKRRSPSPDKSNPFKASSDEHSELDLPHPAKKTAKRHPSPSNSQQDNTSDSDSDMPPAKKRTRATSRTAKSASAKPAKPPPSTIPDFSQDSEGDDDWMGPVTTALTTTATRKATGNSGNKEARASEKRSAQNVASKGPRISRVNKSAKSKEIFGFPIPGGVTPIFGFGAAPVVITPDVPTPGVIAPMAAIKINVMEDKVVEAQRGDEEGHDQQPINADSDPDVADIHGTERQASNKLGETPTASAADITNTGTTLRDPANTHDEQPQKESTTRLANPATRGKKAASRADAAGKAPEIMVPFDPVLSPTKIAAPLPKKQLALAPTKVPQLNRSGSSSSSNAQDNKPTDLGGFTKANGGAWSRHASDLLGITRPKRGL